MKVNQLHRAAHFSQQLFYHYRKQVFEFPIRRIAIGGSRISVYEGDPRGRTLFPFPEKMVNTREAREALLSYRACESALGRICQTFVLASEGLYKKVEEVLFDAKNPLLEVYRPGATSIIHLLGGPPIDLRKPIMSHLILRISFKSGKDYAVDISGAQFGFHEPVLPWAEYESQRVHKIKATYPLGHQKQVLDNMLFPDASRMASFQNGKAVGDEMDKVLDGWLRLENIKLAAIMKLGPQAYEAKSAQVLEVLSESMAKFVKAGASNKKLVLAI